MVDGLTQYPGRLHGVPMYRPAAEKKRVFVTIEYPDGTVKLKLWHSWSVRSIRRSAKELYPTCHLQFGNWF